MLDHMVVIMFENRSFDNLLGTLYQPGEKPGFEGVHAGSHSNSVPADADGADQGVVLTHPATGFSSPYPDPGEEFPHVNTQLFGTVDPVVNRFSDVADMAPPFNSPAKPSDSPTMDGFVADYVNTYKNSMRKMPSRAAYAQILSYYTPEQIPVLSGLARSFVCFDHWFCEVPSQTYPNRSFFHSGTSSGFVLNGPPGKFELNNSAPTVFDRLMAAGKSWKVYFDPAQLVSATGLIHASRLAPHFATRFAGTLDFLEDARAGTLPNYAFIEPNMFHPHTDMHPHSGARFADALHIPAPDTLLGGEQLLSVVYDAIRKSTSSAGSNWSNTALLITFDEHGGCFDHVPPPAAEPPTGTAEAGEQGFRFDRSGVRIPTVLVSAWAPGGSVISDTYRATSLIATLRAWWRLGDPLTRRDASAQDFLSVLSRDEPVPAESWPELPPRRKGVLGEIIGRVEAKLEDLELHFGRLERDLLGEALHLENRQKGSSMEIELSGITHRQAHAHFRRLGEEWFPQVVRPRA